MIKSTRDRHGRFANGNPGGPGRPKRSTENDYLAVLRDTVSLDDWRDVVARALLDAKAGDTAARTWLTKYLVGERPPDLSDLAAAEEYELQVEELIRSLDF